MDEFPIDLNPKLVQSALEVFFVLLVFCNPPDKNFIIKYVATAIANGAAFSSTQTILPFFR
ncbi:hypothetical protein H6S82_28340 [Planktothrix sp. FACHB-1355]|uniref:Uncharacterized protein n=2 Tax=Cyanophyceae TaxID=3028117 RepID=A0A926VK80_9CYAN|nr:hypothetical protein [Aerosakkonema funiforme FACHB-1375]MBD3562722.1 hypothetical protein [Planktothrix sp. FACHB-1355]